MKTRYIWALIFLLAASLACSVPFIGGKEDTIAEDTPSEVDGLPNPDDDTYNAAIEDPSLLVSASLSSAQAQILNLRNAPNRFVIQFGDGMRQETWYYDRVGYEVTFRNGEIYTESNVEVLEGEAIFYSIYYPWQFTDVMGMPELLSITGSETFVHEIVEEIFEEDLSIVYLKGLDVGFREDQILYIRTIPLGEGAKEGSPAYVLQQLEEIEVEPTESTPVEHQGLTLTPEELIYQGTHHYHIECTYSDGDSEDLYDDIIYEFTEEGIYMNGDGPIPSRNIENSYGISDDDFVMILTFEEDLVRQEGSFFIEDDQGNPVEVSYSCTNSPVDD